MRATSLRGYCSANRCSSLSRALAVALVVSTAGLGSTPGFAASVATTRAANPGQPSAASSKLSHHAMIARGIEYNLKGDLDAAMEVWAALRAKAPAHPAAPVFEASTLFWHQMFDDADTRWDDALLTACDEGIAKAEAILEEDPQDLEGNLYAGFALMSRGRVKGIRGKYYAAGTDGERARKHLEQVLALEPGLVDAKMQLGLYYFYASMVPGLVSKWLGWLWFIPTGNRDEGIGFLEEVAAEGDLYRDPARYLLSSIYVYQLEGRVMDGHRLLADLHARYPNNTHIHFEYVESLVELGRFDAVAREAVLLRQSPHDGEGDRARKQLSKIWQARALLETGRLDEARALLEPMRDWMPAHPHWGKPYVNLVNGMWRDIEGDRKAAKKRYEKVLAHRAAFDNDRAKSLARGWLERPFAAPPELTPAVATGAAQGSSIGGSAR